MGVFEWERPGSLSPPCFYGSPEQTIQTLALERTSSVFFFVFFVFFFTVWQIFHLLQSATKLLASTKSNKLVPWKSSMVMSLLHDLVSKPLLLAQTRNLCTQDRFTGMIHIQTSSKDVKLWHVDHMGLYVQGGGRFGPQCDTCPQTAAPMSTACNDTGYSVRWEMNPSDIWWRLCCWSEAQQPDTLCFLSSRGQLAGSVVWASDDMIPKGASNSCNLKELPSLEV